MGRQKDGRTWRQPSRYLSLPLLQVPMAYQLLGPGQRVGILTARENLTSQNFAGLAGRRSRYR